MHNGSVVFVLYYEKQTLKHSWTKEAMTYLEKGKNIISIMISIIQDNKPGQVDYIKWMSKEKMPQKSV